MRELRWGCLVVGALSLAGCRHVPDVKEQQAAQNYYELGVIAQRNGNVPDAYTNFKKALELDDSNKEIHLAMGLLMQFSYDKPDAAKKEYERALELDPAYTEARVNLGTVYLQQGAYEQAIPLFKDALNDMAYRTPYIAESDLGWALYKSGKVDEGVNHIQAAVTVNPGFCLGYRQLGQIAESRNDEGGACQAFHQFQKACSDNAEASYRVAVCEAKLGHPDASKEALEACVKGKGDPALLDQCRTKLEQVSRTVVTPPPSGAP